MTRQASLFLMLIPMATLKFCENLIDESFPNSAKEGVDIDPISVPAPTGLAAYNDPDLQILN